jgi:hypothetical protein
MGVLESGNTLFLNVSCGFLVNKKKEISTRGYEGILESISQETDEFEGKPIDKIKLHMRDHKTDEKAVISFTAESWYAVGFFQRIENIDLTKPFTLGVSQSEQNEKISFCWMKQGGKKIEKNAEIPVPETVTVGKKEIKDFEKFLEEAGKIIQRLNYFTPKEEPEPAEEPTEEPEPIDGNDKLPF